MLLRNLFILYLAISMPLVGGAQTLAGTLQQLSGALQEVAGEKASYEQALAFDKDKPYRVVFTCREVALKDGKQKTHRYELNLADIDRNLVRRVTTTKTMGVSVGARRALKAVKYFQDDVQQSYQDDFLIYAKDSENMEAIETLLREAAPMAEKLWEASLDIDLKNLPGMVAWLGANISAVTVGENSYEQALTQGDRADLVKLRTEARTKKGSSTSQATFSLADLQEQKVSYKVKGAQVVVEADIQQGMNLVTLEVDGALRGYVSGFEVQCNDLDEAKRLVLVLQKTIPAAKESLRQVTKTPQSLTEAVLMIKGYVRKVETGKRVVEQAFDGECAATLNVQEADDKRTTQYVYSFDFSDIDEKKVALNIKGTSISVTLSVARNQKFIKVLKDGELANYASQVTIDISDVETARFLEPCLLYAIKQCEPKAEAKDLSWLQAHLAGLKGDGIEQTLTQQADNPCKHTLEARTALKKGTQEEVYEFNLKDIDPTKIDLQISGTTVAVLLPTKGKQKLINYYKDGNPSYIAQLAITVGDVAQGKIFRDTIKALTEGCK